MFACKFRGRAHILEKEFLILLTNEFCFDKIGLKDNNFGMSRKKDERFFQAQGIGKDHFEDYLFVFLAALLATFGGMNRNEDQGEGKRFL